ncbi:MAG TPA: SDR family oxidoreductase [Bryobacteraceae bacterium]|jgi:NAD(P)-dependent dehydrogenase (short-subunit alcohol dehydrogenase family)
MGEFLTNKRTLVTGSSRGIGFAIAEALVSAGANTVLCARNGKALDAAADRLRRGAQGRTVAAYPADVSKSDEVAGLFRFADEALGGLDILVNNAGFGLFRVAAELSAQEWDGLIATNLSAAFYCSREALQRFRQSGGGWIINIGSLAGKNPFSGGSGYNAAKFGLTGFTEAMMMDHRHDNVKVSYIMPGSVDTQFGGAQSSTRSDWKIAPGDIAQIVLDVLKMPERTLISRVEVRPSRPPKN